MTDESKGTATYTVQMRRRLWAENDRAVEAIAWVDIATVEVAAKSKRRTIFGRALAESGLRPEVGGEPLRLRALDARSAHVTEVVAKAVDPQLEWS